MTTSFRSKALAAAITLAAVSAANASPFVINNGQDFGNNGSSSTSSIKSLGFTGTTATSIYLGNPAVAGTSVIDTNIASEMSAFGFTAGSKVAMDGLTPLTFAFPTFAGPLNIDALNNDPSGVADENGFATGVGTNKYGVVSPEGKTWGLTYQYKLLGQTTATDVQYTGGFLDIFYQTDANGAGAKQVLRLNVTGSQFQGVNLNLLGLVSFDFDDDGDNDADAFVQSFWKDELTNKSFYEHWSNGSNSAKWAINTNVVPPIPTLSQLWQSTDANGNPGALFRQSTLNGTLEFTVPEPGSLALFGLALAGMGFVRRKQSGK
ncbi:PEP-CTERM sorting domain-containing protein [Roseateles sp.]|jgi:hypothetical protein|uniref:PEP-CTERM sorting domain-containing protein n=1 Tax=Roseateles sp. TaxID=1971397 RepID=UPI0037C66057